MQVLGLLKKSSVLLMTLKVLNVPKRDLKKTAEILKFPPFSIIKESEYYKLVGGFCLVTVVISILQICSFL